MNSGDKQFRGREFASGFWKHGSCRGRKGSADGDVIQHGDPEDDPQRQEQKWLRLRGILGRERRTWMLKPPPAEYLRSRELNPTLMSDVGPGDRVTDSGALYQSLTWSDKVMTKGGKTRLAALCQMGRIHVGLGMPGLDAERPK